MKHLFLLFVIAAMVACTNSTDKADKENMEGDVVENADKVFTTDELKANFADYTGKEVTVEGIVKHVCSHGGVKMFIKGDSTNIKIMAGESGNFVKDEVMYNKVAVTGVVEELVIDKDYIMQMEADLEADIANGEFDKPKEDAEMHEEDNPEHEGLDKGAHLDEHDRDVEIEKRKQQIQDVKDMLAESGKESLSFYSIDANSYEIVEVMPKPENAEDQGCTEEETEESDEECDDDKKETKEDSQE